MTSWLVDTGPLVAYLDARDPAHAAVARCLDGFSGRLATTGAVITEAMYFVASTPTGPRLLADLVTGAGIRVHDVAQPGDLRRAVELMERFRDTPMDYADATLLILADRLDVTALLTLDRRGFAAYRSPEGRSLELVLDTRGSA